MKIHYSYSPVHRLTACGLVATDIDIQPHVTHDPDEITCKSCIRCFDSYITHQRKIRESMAHLSNEELLVMVVEKSLVLWHRWHTSKDVADVLAVLLFRLMVTGFITEPDKVDIDYKYI